VKVRDVIKRLERVAGGLLVQKAVTGNIIIRRSLGRLPSSVTGHTSGNLEQYPEAGRFEMKYLVVYEKSDTGWGAYVPDLPGLGAVAATLDEIKELIREAIEFHVEGLREHGDPIPLPAATTEYINI
jgi:predicted RNase H-like HicB family nuclease